jgi:effector-binding domain-containing protein
VTWAIDPMSGAMIRPSEDAAVMQRIWAMTRGESWREHFARARCTGSQKVNGRDCWVVQLEPESGDAMTLYVDQKTKLVAGVDVNMPTPAGRDDVQVRVTKWKTVDGIQYSEDVDIKTKYVAIEYRYEEIVHNAEIPASRFELPPAIRKLRDEKNTEGATDGGVEVAFREVPERHVASVRVKVKPEHIGQTLAQILPEVMACLTEAGITPAAPPFTRYYSFSKDEIDLEAGFPVLQPIEAKGRVAPSKLPGGKVAEAWHHGDYRQLSTTWTRVEAWLKKQPGVEMGDERWEVYWTDPGREPDVSKWRTQVLWKVRQ